MELTQKIQKLKEEKNAVILAHYYTSDEVQALSDYVGDSFYLAKIAKGCTADIIVFCGVSFMGESAKILSPDKIVLMPDLSADCPMAHMADKEKIKSLRERYPDLAVVCYINSTAELKVLSDVCVTSSNALKIVKSLPNKNIFFIPDKNLGRYVKEQVPEKNIIINDGYCHIHTSFTADSVTAEKELHKNALVLSHPECNADITAISDFVGSTADIIEFAKKSDAKEFIICTEEGVLYKLMSDNPDKKFYFPKSSLCCADMKLNTPEKIYNALKNETGKVELDKATITKALAPLDKMLELAK